MKPGLMSRGLAALVVGVLAVSGCSRPLTTTEQGAIFGAGAGAAIGAVVGDRSGHTARGAIIGAVIGGAAGAIIGAQMDRQAAELEQNIPGAKVERIGEGIQVTFESGLLFDFDSDRIRSDAALNLRNFAASLKNYPNTDILIVGHTDSVGTQAYNQNLSERRAASARNFLIAERVAANRLRIAGRGELEPVAANATDAGRQQNRRVEVAIYANEALKAQARSLVAR
jgi:outer membrane protein OmpA-like peptidoglycan-associated protein